jgi:acyl-CoA synthetase (NDP forming)
MISEGGTAQRDRHYLVEPEALALVKTAGLPVVEHRTATSVEETVAAADQLGYPVALKIVSREIVHKTDAGGVQLDLRDAAAVAAAHRRVIDGATRHRPGARVDGVLVSRMAKPGVEAILGLTRDPQFGPALMFGLGGIFVEVYRDVAFRLVPISEQDANEMIREIKGFPLLTGARGRRARDVAAIVRSLLTLSDLAESRPEMEALDLNPVILYEQGCVVVDAKVFLAAPAGRTS